MAKRVNDGYNRKWIIENAIEICDQYSYGVLTIRGLHYQLVGAGMPNTERHYSRVCAAMAVARRAGQIAYEQFSDNDRETIGTTDYQETDLDSAVETAKSSIQGWLTYYFKNRWENQEHYIEVFIEKKALQGVFGPACNSLDVALSPCKGYPSLTFLNDAATRFSQAQRDGKETVILYFGDYDPSGEDIPRAIYHNLINDFGIEVEVRRCLLLEEQVKAWGLPPAPLKSRDTRSMHWDGLGQVELDAVEPKKLQRLCTEFIEEYLDPDLYQELQDQEEQETEEYRAELKEYVKTL